MRILTYTMINKAKLPAPLHMLEHLGRMYARKPETLPTLAAEKTAAWRAYCEQPDDIHGTRAAAYLRAARAYDRAIVALALIRPDMNDFDRESFAPFEWTDATEKDYAAALEKWRAIVHPQEFDAQPA